jgi:hypothetical protein
MASSSPGQPDEYAPSSGFQGVNLHIHLVQPRRFRVGAHFDEEFAADFGDFARLTLRETRSLRRNFGI